MRDGGGTHSARRLIDDIAADHRKLVTARRRYDTRRSPKADGLLLLVSDFVTHAGFQQLVFFRCASALHRHRATPVAMLICRLIRFLYGAEMHWATDVAPGVLLVHGNGIVISRDARIGAGCVISHNVTIGISRSPDGRDGAPVLLDDVHLGPGATILGPITLGPDSKVGPNAVVVSSVPPRMSVLAPEPVVTPRPPSNEPVDT